MSGRAGDGEGGDGTRRGAGEQQRAASDRLWLPLNALRAFEAVGNASSFTAAAAALHVSQSALSRHVGRLEELIGRRLLDRRPGGVVLTAAGAALLPVISASFDRLDASLLTLRREGSGPRVLHIHMPPTFLTVFGVALLKDFRAAFPDILIDVSSSNGIGLPAAKTVDVAVVFDKPRVDDRVRDLLWVVSCTPVCAPALAAEVEGRPLEEFLRGADLLHTKLEGEPFGALWADYARHQNFDIGPRRGLAFETEALSVQWAIAGGGVMLIDEGTWRADIANGRLVAIGPTMETAYGYYLTFHPDDLHDPAVALFRSFLIAHFTPDEG